MSIHLQIGLLAAHRYFTMFPGSLMRFGAERFSLRALPIKLRVSSLPIGIVTLRGRTPSPSAELFIRTVQEVTRAFRA